MVHPISSTGGNNPAGVVAPTAAFTAVVQGLESLLTVMQNSGKDYLAELSPSQLHRHARG